ncbi:hypothetical protein MTR67_039390 [Solanum verrucosum]|uniref:Uncharacterized protein n=1 Tax=Solanum verrucosum TaxID=315347 RepID=A0AAF0UHU8_SOLVR|nr:hypothetical protein MTR67_039390 [Solanum verrucosum]
MHKKDLHVTIMCQDKVINRFLVDEGSGLNIFPLLTLKKLNFNSGNDVKWITSRPFTRSQAQDLQQMQGIFMKMKVIEMVLTTSKEFHALKITEEVPFGEQGPLGASPNGLDDGPSLPNVTERG